MNQTLLIFIIITLHFIGDWVLQPRSRAKSKKTNTSDLLDHILNEVSLYLIIITVLLFQLDYGDKYTLAAFWLINLFLHMIIDMLLPAGNNERQLINMTALDQILHIGCLLLTLEYFIL